MFEHIVLALELIPCSSHKIAVCAHGHSVPPSGHELATYRSEDSAIQSIYLPLNFSSHHRGHGVQHREELPGSAYRELPFGYSLILLSFDLSYFLVSRSGQPQRLLFSFTWNYLPRTPLHHPSAHQSASCRS